MSRRGRGRGRGRELSYYVRNHQEKIGHGDGSTTNQKIRYTRRQGRPHQLSPEEVELELAKVNDSLPENRILLLSILNSLHPITVETLHKVCRSMGLVDRIVIFDKGNFIQAMVEFRDLEAALKAKKSLHGCDIYPDCCTLRVEFGRQEKLNVKSNTPHTWDFTVEPSGPKQRSAPPARRKVLLTEGPPGVKNTNGLGYMAPLLDLAPGPFQGGFGGNGLGGGYTGGHVQSHVGGHGGGHGHVGGHGGHVGGHGLGPGAGYHQGNRQENWIGEERSSPVLMVYSLDADRFNCQRLFNLLCLYGNVVKINFLKSKDGCAMVEFDDSIAVERACRNLNQTKVFGSRLRLEPSRKDRVEDIRKPFELPDGSDSFESFYRDRNNRFDTPERAAKNRPIPPTRVLHFYNTPHLSEDRMEGLFVEHDAACPTNVRWFEPKREGSRTGSGVAEFECVEDAVEALVLVNNVRVEAEQDGREFDMKLCFSKNFSF